LSNEKKSSKIKKIIPTAILILVGAGVMFLLGYTPEEDITIRENRVSVHLHAQGFFTALAGGYDVHFDDIADIELLPYSARQLSEKIDDLTVPRGRLYRTANREPIITVARYDDESNHRIHVSLFPDAAPTIWITRYENGPVLLSFRYGYETEALYKQIVEAWEQWQAS